jgi:hypothetical protein
LKDVLPGEYSVTTSMTNTIVKFTVVSGQKQFIRLSYSLGFNIYPELVDPLEGEREIQDLSYTPKL